MSTKQEKRIQMTSKEFASYQPSINQLFDNEIQISERRVATIRENTLGALRSSVHPVVVDGDRNRIISGHHRHEANSRDLKEKKIDPNAFFPATVLYGVSTEELSRAVYEANNDVASGNHSTHAVLSKMDASQKVIGPIFKAFLRVNPKYPFSRAKELSRKFAGVLNDNPILVSNLKEGKFLSDVKDTDFYTTKNGVAGKNFHRAEVNVDLRTYVDNICDLLAPYVNFRTELTNDGIWKEKFGNVKNFDYILMAMSIRGEFGEGRTLTPKKLKTIIKNNGSKIKKLAKLYQDDAARYSDSIRAILLAG